MVHHTDHLVTLRVERHPCLRVARIAELLEHLQRLFENAPHTLDDRVGLVTGMTDRPLQVVHDGQPRAGHPGSFRCSFAVQFAGIPLAQVVQIGDRAPPAVLELGQLRVRIRLGGNRF